MTAPIFTRDLVPIAELADAGLPAQIAALEERIAKFRAENPTEADEVERLVKLADDLRQGPSKTPAAISREDAAEITRLAALAGEVRGVPAEAPELASGDDRDPGDASEIARLSTLAKERA
jgi:hypothetical protein